MDIKSYALDGLNFFSIPALAAFIEDGYHAFSIVTLYAGQCPDHCDSTVVLGEGRVDTAT